MTYPHNEYQQQSGDDYDFGIEMGEVPEQEPRNFDKFPPGPYKVMAVSAERVPTRDQGGETIKVRFDITEGEFQGRAIFHRFNVVNRSEKAVIIALSDLKAWRAACYMDPHERLTMGYINAMLNVEFVGIVKYGKTSPEYPEAQPEIKQYKPVDQFQPPQYAQRQAPPAAPQRQAPPAPQQRQAPPPAQQRQAPPPAQQAQRPRQPWER
jgi:hypothetical protein